MERNSPDGPNPEACTTPDCCGSPSRREFLQVVGLGGMAALTAGLPAVAGPFEGADFEKLVPADKKLRPEWLKSLVSRGEPTVHRGAELEKIGMPVGGIGAGQLYLGGDGKLWHWDLFNLPPSGNFTSAGGPNFARPPKPASPLEQGFALRVAVDGQSQVRVLDQRGFKDIAFRGQYPVGFVDYRDQDLPVSVSLEAFSPFIPLNVEDSTLPATVMRFTVKNTGSQPVEFGLAGWLENAVCLGSGRQDDGRRRNHVLRERGLTLLHCTAEATPKKGPADKRADVLFEDFEKDTYEGWKVEGTAFGRGPVKRSDAPRYMGDLGGKGQHVVNSHASAPGKDVRERDDQKGKLTSKDFLIERHYINFFIGGGNKPGKTCLNLLVDGKVVRSATGHNRDHMQEATFDVRDLQGKRAVIEIVDAAAGSWGNVGADHIVFSDRPAEPFVLEKQGDYGSMALALLGESDGSLALASVPLDETAAQAIWSPDQKRTTPDASKPFREKLGGALGRGGTLKPGEQADVTFVVTWYFPALPHRFDRLQDARDLRRSYATRFDSAAAVARYVANKFDELAGQTRLWNKTWYDSTLPYWFLDRTFLTVDCLATGMAYHFNNGRFYAFEGTYCCDGTCTHVWQYAHAMARLFPALERTTRERVDYGIAFHADTGAMDYRAEYDRRVAHDGQAGTILRAYREHQCAADDQFLRRYWPKIKKSIEYLINRDAGPDGLLDGEQYNTLDASWYGHIAWISSLYLACVRAGAAMAREMGDEGFAKQCDAINENGSKNMAARLFNGEYFIQTLDPEHLKAINTNEGCHIDQVFGESWAFQVGLPRVLPAAPTKSALEALWKYNFTPDVGPYRREFKAIPGGRWYAMPGEGGLLMCTWPKGGADQARGQGSNPGFVGYFNECMTGFEYQVAAHMVWEGLVEKGLAITRMIHDRYHALRHNPWNEVECSDHYARAMASYGVFLAACGFESHGPKGHLGFAPRLTPEKFRAPFTAAEGWGTFTQERTGTTQRATLDVHWGKLRLRTLSVELPAEARPTKVTVRTGGEAIAATHHLDGSRCTITLGADTVVAQGQSLQIHVE